MKFVLVIECCKVSFTISLISTIAIVQTFSFVKQNIVFSTITDPSFVESLQSYVMGHTTCLFVNLWYQAVVPVNLVKPCATAHIAWKLSFLDRNSVVSVVSCPAVTFDCWLDCFAVYIYATVVFNLHYLQYFFLLPSPLIFFFFLIWRGIQMSCGTLQSHLIKKSLCVCYIFH